MKSLIDFLVCGNFLRPGSTIRDIRFGPNGFRLIRNLIENHKKSLGCSSPEFFLKTNQGNGKQICDEHFLRDEKSRKLFSDWKESKTEEPLTFIRAPYTESFNADSSKIDNFNSDSSNIDICFTSFTFLSSFSGQGNFSFQDYFRTRRQFWKKLFFDPATTLNFVETDSNGTTPFAKIESKVSDSSENLTVETIRLSDESETAAKVFESDESSFVRMVESKSYLNAAAAAILLTSVRKRIFLNSTRLGKFLIFHFVFIFTFPLDL